MMMMKNLNGTSRDGGDVNYKEGMKLLDIGSSDSDIQEHFALPPLELKGGRKKKGRTKAGGVGGAGGCNCCRGFAAFLLLAAIVGIAGVGFFTYSLHKELQELKKKFESVETGSQSNPEEFQMLHTQVQDLQAEIKKIKTGGATSLESHQSNISAIVKQISLLNLTTQSLSRSLAAAPELEELPTQVISLQKNVAEIGSDVKSLKTEKADLSFKPLEDKIYNISRRLSVLEGGLLSAERPPVPSGPDLRLIQQSLRKISQDLDAVNTTVWMQIADLRMHSNQHMAELEEVQNMTLTLGHRVAFLEMAPPLPAPTQPGQLQALVQKAVGHAMLNVSRQKGDSVDSGEMQELHRGWLNTTFAISVLRRQLQQLNVSEALTTLTARVDSLALTTTQQIEGLSRNLVETKKQVSDIASNVRGHEDHLVPAVPSSPQGTGTVSAPPTERTIHPVEDVDNGPRNEDSNAENPPQPNPSTVRVLPGPLPPSSSPGPLDESPTPPASQEPIRERGDDASDRGRQVRGSPSETEKHALDGLVNAIQNGHQ